MTVNNRLLGKLVFSSMKNNKKTLVPFLLASSITIMVYYILASLAFGPYIYHNGVEAFYGAKTIAILLEMASQIIAIFSYIFIFYANQFVMKERKREFGLYGVLGLSRRNIAKLLTFESLINGGICIVSGIVAGTLLNKIMLLILYKIAKQPPVEGLFFAPMALKNALIIYVIAFVLCCIYNTLSINVGNPIDLLRSNSAGEKEPKVKWLTLLVGFAALAGGYHTALSCASASEAISYIFVAIFLVILATYCLFITGSIFLLKALKRNKKFYYKTRNFVSVSNLIYRMKHNAAGLASICILSTAVILLITCATSLMMLGRKNINIMYPNDIMIREEVEAGNVEEVYTKALSDIAKESGMEPKEIRIDTLVIDMLNNSPDGFEKLGPGDGYDTNKQAMLYLLTAKEYEHLTGEKVELNSNQILYADTHSRSFKSFNFCGREFEVKGLADTKKSQRVSLYEMSLYNNAYMVVADENVREELYRDIDSPLPELVMVAGIDLKESVKKEDIPVFNANMLNRLGFENVSFKVEDEQMFVSLYGGVFFVGVFLAAVFLMATVLIIYYKQMSEGYEDKKRYEILKKVGLTDREVRFVIKRQVMILFFLPVFTAIIHMMVASKIVRLFLSVVLLVDTFTFNMSILGVALVFLFIYSLVYKITSNEYYNIVN